MNGRILTFVWSWPTVTAKDDDDDRTDDEVSDSDVGWVVIYLHLFRAFLSGVLLVVTDIRIDKIQIFFHLTSTGQDIFLDTMLFKECSDSLDAQKVSQVSI